MLYLLKASRVREYQKENLSILCAEEREAFSVTYSRRWVQPGLTIEPGSGAAIVFADSPYETYVPVRFAQIEQVDDTDERITVSGVLGPLICADDPGCLTTAWLPGGNDRPGKSHFLFEDDNRGLGSPRGPDDQLRAWERITTSLRDNAFFARSTFARVTQLLDAEGVPVDPAEGVGAGAELLVELDVRPPDGGPAPGVHLASEPPDAVEPVGEAVEVGEHRIRVGGRVRLASGGVRLRASFRPDPLQSCRPHLMVAVKGSAPLDGGLPATATSGSVALDVPALVRFLEREGDLSDALWLELCEEHLLPGCPDEPALLAAYADHAEALGQHDRAHDALLRIHDRSPAADEALLRCSLRIGDSDLVGDLVTSTDVSDSGVFAQLLAAAEEAPPGAVHVLVERVLDANVLGDAKLTDLVRRVAPRITSTDLLAKAAERMAYVEPTSAATMLMGLWEDPEQMPERILDLLVDWDVERDRIGPYLRHRIDHAAHDGDVAALRRLVDQVRRQGATTQRAELLAAAGLPLLLADERADADLGFEVLLQAARELAGLGEVGPALDVLTRLRVHERLWRSTERAQAIEDLQTAIDEAMDRDDRFIAWERQQESTIYDDLKPKLTNRTLHLFGGWWHDWADELERNLGVAKLVWHESDKAKSPDHGWSKKLDPEVDVVVALTDFMGHEYSKPVRDSCARKGVVYLHAKQKKLVVLQALRDGL